MKVSALLDCKPAILGAGTNVLAPDEGVRGLVICLKDCLEGMEQLDLFSDPEEQEQARKERQAREAEVNADVAAHFADIFPGRESEVADALYYLNKEVMRRKILDEGIRPEFVGIVNYAIIGLIQLELGYAEASDDMNETEALEAYDRHAQKALDLMLRKNHDYDEAWRGMRVSSYTDLILMKIFRTKQIESLHGETLVSEGIDANYMDMMNYAVFGLIKLTYGEK